MKNLLTTSYFCVVVFFSPPHLQAADIKVYPDLMVCAAASLGESLAEMCRLFEAGSGSRCFLNLAGSNTLRLQIEHGASCDIYISANTENVDILINKNLTQKNDTVRLMGNRLVVIAQQDFTGQINDLNDLLHWKDGPIAMADPETVPAGLYVQQALIEEQIWLIMKDAAAPAPHVRAALKWVSSGHAPLGIVYQTDAQIEPGIKILYQLPLSQTNVVTYMAALLTKSKGNNSAVEFYQYLTSPAAKQVFQSYGFSTDDI